MRSWAEYRQCSAASSSGRTPDFGSGNTGSTPVAASIDLFDYEIEACFPLEKIDYYKFLELTKWAIDNVEIR